MHELYELKDKLLNELSDYGSKEELTSSSLDVIDKLAHTVKNLCKIIEYSEYSIDGGSYDGSMRRGSYDGSMRGSYRGSYDGGSYRGSYDGGSYDGSMRGSYARGRGRNARRDNMGRYSSANEMMSEQLHELMQDAPDERTRQEIQKMITKLDQM